MTPRGPYWTHRAAASIPSASPGARRMLQTQVDCIAGRPGSDFQIEYFRPIEEDESRRLQQVSLLDPNTRLSP